MAKIRQYKGTAPTIGEKTYIDDAAVVIGDVMLGDDVSVWPMVTIRGDVNSIRIGSKTNIQDGSVLHVTHRNSDNTDGFALTIGDGVTVGHNAILHGCKVGNYCLIGMGAQVLDGAVLHDHVMIGAGSLVPPGKELEGGYLYVGSPARKVRPLTDKELAWFDYSAKHYIKLKDEYLAEA